MLVRFRHVLQFAFVTTRPNVYAFHQRRDYILLRVLYQSINSNFNAPLLTPLVLDVPCFFVHIDGIGLYKP